MYIIHNKTKHKTFSYEGSWPDDMLEKMLEAGDRVIVISLYSNTIKVPYSYIDNGIKVWEWDDYPLFNYFNHYAIPV